MIFYYSTTLWQAVGFSESDSFLASVINSLVNVLATVVAILIVDRVGRKPMLLGGSAGMVVTLGIMAVAFSQAIITVGADGSEEPSLPGAVGPDRAGRGEPLRGRVRGLVGPGRLGAAR